MVIAIQFTIINETIILLNHQDRCFAIVVEVHWPSYAIISLSSIFQESGRQNKRSKEVKDIASACLLLYICSIKDSTLESLLVMIRTTSWNVNSRYFLFSTLDSNQLVLNRPLLRSNRCKNQILNWIINAEYHICYLLLMGLYVYDS